MGGHNWGSTLRRRIAVFATGVALAIGAAAPADAANRLALVIGNDAYEEVSPLERAVADARAYRDLLEQTRGFKVYFAENARRRDMNALVAQFLGAIRPGDTAMVIYSGHGVQLDPERRDSLYLLPVDFPNQDPGRGAERHFFDAESLNFARLAENVVDRGAELRIFVLDACRNNPFERKGSRAIGMSRGLGRIQSTSGEFVIYAAAPGEVAFDSLPGNDTDSENSVFTRAFIKHFRPGRFLEDVANDVQAEVAALTKGANLTQLPYSSDGVPGWTCLDDKCGEDVVEKDTGKDAGPGLDSAELKAREELYWSYCESNSDPVFCRTYLEVFPDAWRAPLAAARLAQLMRQAGLDPDKTGGTHDNSGEDSGNGSGETTTRDDTGSAKDTETGDANTSDAVDSKSDDTEVAVAPPTEPEARNRSLFDPSRDQVRDAQARLTILGYRPGPVDGQMGRRTRGALQDFQSSNGLPADGELNGDVWEHLVRAVPEAKLQGFYEDLRQRREAAARAERERAARREEERREREAARERTDRNDAARERQERERLQREHAERDRLAREQATRDRQAREQAAREEAERERKAAGSKPKPAECIKVFTAESVFDGRGAVCAD